MIINEYHLNRLFDCEYNMIVVNWKEEYAVIEFNNPSKLNALNEDLLRSALRTFNEVVKDGRAKSVIITGAGRAFSAGADIEALKQVRNINKDSAHRLLADMMEDVGNAFVESMLNSPIPVICAINGPCVGGGVGIALAADVTLAARSAYLLVPQVSTLGLVPDLGATWLLSRAVGRARALGISLLGGRISAEIAERWGLIWSCVDDSDLEIETEMIARRLCAVPAEAVTETRRLIHAALESNIETQLALERKVQRSLFKSDFPWAVFERISSHK